MPYLLQGGAFAPAFSAQKESYSTNSPSPLLYSPKPVLQVLKPHLAQFPFLLKCKHCIHGCYTSHHLMTPFRFSFSMFFPSSPIHDAARDSGPASPFFPLVADCFLFSDAHDTSYSRNILRSGTAEVTSLFKNFPCWIQIPLLLHMEIPECVVTNLLRFSFE